MRLAIADLCVCLSEVCARMRRDRAPDIHIVCYQSGPSNLATKSESYHSKSCPVANKDAPHEHGRLRDDLTHVAALDLHSCAVQDAGSLESGIVAQTAGGHVAFCREDLKSRAGLTCAIGDAGRDGSLFEIAFQVPQLYAVVWRKK
jgi:hypothetical protein